MRERGESGKKNKKKEEGGEERDLEGIKGEVNEKER